MERLVIQGGNTLNGTVRVHGAKNAVLPIMAASLLAADGISLIEEVPDLQDVRTMKEVLLSLGAKIEEGDALAIDSRRIETVEAPYELIGKMRASFLVMGPLLARMGRVRLSFPGGCAIGNRPIDQHLKGFEALGAKIRYDQGYIEAESPKLIGTSIYLDIPSVGATENIMMAACFAHGETIIENAAEEPEITDLANFLNKMGAKIRGAGTDTIRIEGVSHLTGTRHTVIPDRIEAGTYLIAFAITGGEGFVEGAISAHLVPVIAKLREMGFYLSEEEGGIHIVGNRELKPADVKTLPYPGFPTDMQPQFMALLTKAKGTSVVTETIFENRFMHVPELVRMGAKIRTDGRTAVIEESLLKGAAVKATDLRAGAALILAGLAAEGTTEIAHLYHIDRGYVNIEKTLSSLGAKIDRISDKTEESLKIEEEKNLLQQDKERFFVPIPIVSKASFRSSS